MKRCSYCDSDDRVFYSSRYGDLLCHKHYMQVYHTGIIKDRFRNSENEYVLYDDYAEIILLDKYGKEKTRAIIDIEDVERCKTQKWSLHGEGYVSGSKDILLHNFLLNTGDEKLILDHIDRNKLNNRKSNLRVATYGQNNMNSKTPCNNTSGVKGISFDKSHNVYHSYLGINGGRINLGYFKKLIDAIVARLKAEKIYYKEFAPQKHLFKKYGIKL